jgi:hypothetical protein
MCKYCNKKVKSLEMCNTHYERFRKHGDPHYLYKIKTDHLRNYKLVGENSPAHKLTLFQVEEIRNLYKTVKIAELARMFRVTEPNIKKIVTYKTWSEPKNKLLKQTA